MCGISGIVAKESKKYEDHLDKMIHSLNHRGPDSNGKYFFADCALGHNRLAIVDLNSGAQPMPGLDMTITFNGEIYGYEKIRNELMSEYKFKTKSDTEVIMALYKKHGDDFAEHLPGMFSFAIWDESKKQLVAGRDRFGEKPFFYAYGTNGEFIFASEIKAIIASGLVKPEVDTDVMAYYLKRLCSPVNKTIYKNIFTLPPAHTLIFKNGRVETKKYWSLPRINQEISPEMALEGLKTLLEKSISGQLVSDVPVGAFLSGGLDSSTIVSIAAMKKPGLMTFSFGFNESKNETHFAKEIAEKYKTNHIELFPEDHNILDLLNKMQDVYDEPFADSSNIPTYLLSEVAKKHVKVVLTGDGGDELFAGYSNWYKPLLSMHEEKNNSKLKTALLYAAAKIAFSLEINKRKKIQNKYLGSRFRNKFDSIVDAHLSLNTTFGDKEIESIMINMIDPICENIDTKNKNSLDDAFKIDIENYMPADILVKIDRASMANGLELRSPFLDKDFAEFSISIPWQLKINSEEDKAIFRKAFSDLWTENIRKRSKQGFGSPISKFLENKDVNKFKNHIFENPNSKIYDYLSFESIQKYKELNDQKTWTLLMLAMWLEKYKI